MPRLSFGQAALMPWPSGRRRVRNCGAPLRAGLCAPPSRHRPASPCSRRAPAPRRRARRARRRRPARSRTPAFANCARAEAISLPISRPDRAAAAASGCMSSSSVEARMRNSRETASPGCASPSSQPVPEHRIVRRNLRRVGAERMAQDRLRRQHRKQLAGQPGARTAVTAPSAMLDPFAMRAGHADQQVGAVQAGDAGKLRLLAAHHIGALRCRAARRRA